MFPPLPPQKVAFPKMPQAKLTDVEHVNSLKQVLVPCFSMVAGHGVASSANSEWISQLLMSYYMENVVSLQCCACMCGMV